MDYVNLKGLQYLNSLYIYIYIYIIIALPLIAGVKRNPGLPSTSLSSFTFSSPTFDETVLKG